MLGPIIATVFSALGLITPENVLPTFLPYSTPPSPSEEEVFEPFQNYPDFSSLINQYKSGSQGNSSTPSQSDDKLLSLPLSEFISSNEARLKAKVMETLKEGSYRLLRDLFPWETYDFFVPRIVQTVSYLGSGLQWFKKRYRDQLAEGRFLLRLEDEDYFSAGSMAHSRARYFEEALRIARNLYIFILGNTTFHEYKARILPYMQYLREMHMKWNDRRLDLYHMNYLLLEARQAQLVLKLKTNQANDDIGEAATYLMRMNLYENYINALQVAFYNKCMNQKGLNGLERIWDTTSRFVERVGTLLGLDETSQTHSDPPIYLQKLTQMLDEDRSISLKPSTIDHENWDLYDWQLKPPNAFERRFEEEKSEGTPTLESYLFNLLVKDEILIALHLCKSVAKPPQENSVWDKQQEEITTYSDHLNKLFAIQKRVDDILRDLGDAAYLKFEGGRNQANKAPDQPNETDPSTLYASVRECQKLSLLLFNQMVHLKWSLLKKVKDNFNKKDWVGYRAMDSLKRKGLRLVMEGTIWDDTPKFEDSIKTAKNLLADTEGELQKANRLLGRNQQVLVFQGRSDKDPDTIEFVNLPVDEGSPSIHNEPPPTGLLYWKLRTKDIQGFSLDYWETIKQLSNRGVNIFNLTSTQSASPTTKAEKENEPWWSYRGWVGGTSTLPKKEKDVLPRLPLHSSKSEEDEEKKEK